MPIFWDEEELALLRGSYKLEQVILRIFFRYINTFKQLKFHDTYSKIAERNAAISTDYDAICKVFPSFADVATLDDFKARKPYIYHLTSFPLMLVDIEF